MGFGYSYETIEVHSYKDLPQPNRPGKPNTRYVIRNRDGSLHQERFTDKNGYPSKDVDHTGNDDHGIGFPHDHYWNGNHRGDPVPHT